MKLKEKLQKKKTELKEQYQRGKIVTEQIRAERLRKKAEKLSNLKPGSIRRGMAMKMKPLDFMKDHYEYRKTKRQKQDKEED